MSHATLRCPECASLLSLVNHTVSHDEAGRLHSIHPGVHCLACLSDFAFANGRLAPLRPNAPISSAPRQADLDITRSRRPPVHEFTPYKDIQRAAMALGVSPLNQPKEVLRAAVLAAWQTQRGA